MVAIGLIVFLTRGGLAPPDRIDAGALFESFERDPVAADRRYGGERIRVRGVAAGEGDTADGYAITVYAVAVVGSPGRAPAFREPGAGYDGISAAIERGAAPARVTAGVVVFFDRSDSAAAQKIVRDQTFVAEGRCRRTDRLVRVTGARVISVESR